MYQRIAHVAAAFLRLSERLLPPRLLVLAILPAAMVLGGWLAFRGVSFRQHYRFVVAKEPGQSRWRLFWRVWIRRAVAHAARLLILWPDRLGRPRWQRRCEFIGWERLGAALTEGRSVVLATLHYGNLAMIYHWLRSRGVAAAFLASRIRSAALPLRNRLDELADRAYGLQNVPRLFLQDQLWDAQDFLNTGRHVLGVPIEPKSKRRVVVNGDGYSLAVSTGFLTMATMAEAVVLPCLISSPGFLRSKIRFGWPIPEADVARRDRHQAACENIVGQLAPWIADRPEECGTVLLVAFFSPAATTSASKTAISVKRQATV